MFLNFAAFSALALAGVNPQLEKVQNIYILPMGGGMDQFLANRITKLGKMQVVADPQIADTILTDKLGIPFEKRLDLLYGSTKKATDEDEKAPDEDQPEKPMTATDASRERVAKEKAAADNENLMRVTSFGRGNGTFFLVDRRTRSVIWSIYEKPKRTTADELNKTAERIVNRLKHDLQPPVSSEN
jgi:hypothetical protein